MPEKKPSRPISRPVPKPANTKTEEQSLATILVLLQEPYYINRNAKIVPSVMGPHRIEQLKGNTYVLLKLASGRKLSAHVDQLKPHHLKLEPLASEDENSERVYDDPDDQDDHSHILLQRHLQHPHHALYRDIPTRFNFKLSILNYYPSRSPRLSNFSALVSSQPNLKNFKREGCRKLFKV